MSVAICQVVTLLNAVMLDSMIVLLKVSHLQYALIYRFSTTSRYGCVQKEFSW